MLVDWIADPVDARIVTDAFVHWIDHDNLIPLVDSIMSHPVRIQHPQPTTLAADSLLSDTAEVTSHLDLVHTAILWLTIDNALGNTLLSASTLDAHTVHTVALFGLVAKMACLVWAGWTISTVNRWHLSQLPAAHSLSEPHHIRLFLAP